VPAANQLVEGTIVHVPVATNPVCTLMVWVATLMTNVVPPATNPVLGTAVVGAAATIAGVTGWNGGMSVPANEASVILFVKPFSIVALLVGKPVAVILTEVPAGPVLGVTVRVGAAMTKVTACETPMASVICIVCAPGARFSVPAPPRIM